MEENKKIILMELIEKMEKEQDLNKILKIFNFEITKLKDEKKKIFQYQTL